MKRTKPHFWYGIASFICSVSTVIVALVILLKEANQSETEPGLFDLPPPELALFILISPIIHIAGFLFGLASFWLQPNTNGIGLWAMIVSLLLLLSDILVWYGWTS